MNDSSDIKQPTDYPIPPYLYGRHTGLAESAEDQRIALYLPQPEYAPNLEALKETDPDSYRMVIYSWA